jgi:hypothetical protein
MSYGGGGGGGSQIATSSDVVLSNPANAQVLAYNSGTAKWVNQASPLSPLIKRVRLGSYYQTSNGVYNFGSRETTLGRTFDIYSFFISFDSSASSHTEITTAAASHDLLVAWEPQKTVGINFSDILAGVHDAKLDEWITYFASLPCRVYIRFGHEMNGSWSHYSPLYTGSDSSNCTDGAQFAQVWQYVYNRAKVTNAATNIYFVFCPNANDSPSQTGNAMEDFYPGSSYVDVIGYDAYNALSGSYLSADDTLLGNTGQAGGYARVTALHATAPVWLCETGCVDLSDPKDTGNLAAGHSKAQWLSDCARSLVGPRLDAVVFYDWSGTRNWKFDSSVSALAGFQSAFRPTGPVPVDTSTFDVGRTRTADYSSWVGTTFDPFLIANAATPTSGTVYVTQIRLESSAALSKLAVFMNAAATSPVAGQCFAGIYDASGNQLAVTADISGSLNTSSNYRTFTMTSSTTTLAAGTVVYGAILINAATPASLGIAKLLNGVNLSPLTKRSGTAGTAATSLPGTFTPGSLGAGSVFFMAVQ